MLMQDLGGEGGREKANNYIILVKYSNIPLYTPLYKLYRYVLPESVWVLSRFGLKTGIDFDHHVLNQVWFLWEP